MNDEFFFEEPGWRPTTTLLYGIAPRGVGTGQAESANSYRMSLAYEHGIAVAKLRRLISTSERPDELRVSKGELENLVAATGREDLYGCSLSSLHELVAINGDASRRVCLECCRVDLKRVGSRSYGRLLWEIPEVTCCPIHRKRLLIPVCGHCTSGRTFTFIFNRVSLFGVCGKCGTLAYRCSEQVQEAAAKHEIEIARLMEEVVACLSEIRRVDPQSVKNVARKIIVKNGGLVAVADQANLCKSLLSRWLSTPSSRFRLKSYIALTMALKVKLSDMLLGRVVATSLILSHRIERGVHRVVDADLIERVLGTALREGDSLHSVSTSIGYDVKILSRNHPDLCQKLLDEHRLRTVLAKQNRLHAITQEVTDVVGRLRDLGRPLTTRNASLLTGQHWRPAEAKSRFLTLFRRACGENIPNPDMELDPLMVAAAEGAAKLFTSAGRKRGTPA